MGSEFMNPVRLISGGQKFIFPMTYVHLQAVFMIIPMLLLIFLPRRLFHLSPLLHKYAWIFGYKFTTNTWRFRTINLEVFLVYISISKAVAQPIWRVMEFFDSKKNPEMAV